MPTGRRTSYRAFARAAGALAALVFVVFAVLAGPAVRPAAAAAAAAPTKQRAAASVQVSVLSMSPVAPAISSKPQRLTIRLQLTNRTTAALTHVQVTGNRADPLNNLTEVTAAIAGSGAGLVSESEDFASKPKIDLLLQPGMATPVTFTTDMDIPRDADICLCANGGVYPLVFTAHQDTNDGRNRVLGTATTYLPSFTEQPAPVRVSWVWPILDRPHRLDSETVFTDDALAGLVSTNGRLSRSLATVEAVRPSTPMTLLLDPELLDELEVMATEPYTVQSDEPQGTGQSGTSQSGTSRSSTAQPSASQSSTGQPGTGQAGTGQSSTGQPSASQAGTGQPGTGQSGTGLPGTGQQAAAQWLDRLASLLQRRPALSVKLTAFADPDVQTLAQQRLPWQSTLPADMQTRVDTALAGRPAEFDLAWPVQGALGARALELLARDGTHTAVLGSAAVSPADAAGTVPAAAADLRGSGVNAVLTSPPVQRSASGIVSVGGAGLAQLPQLMAQIAIRAGQDPHDEHVLVITPPRYVNPDPRTAAAAIDATTSAVFAKPLALADATAEPRISPVARQLAAVPLSAARLSAPITAGAHAVNASVRTIASMLEGAPAAAQQLTAQLSAGVQRTESSYWALDRGGGERLIGQVRSQADAVTSGVRIVHPASGSYTLGSTNSPLPVTVQNDLAYPVSVRLYITTVNQLPGLNTRPVTATVRPRSKRILRVPTTITRPGRIQIDAELTAPNGQSLGGTALSVHSTVLGTLGVVITVVSGGVLVLALLIRVIRRWRRRGRTRASTAGVLVP